MWLKCLSLRRELPALSAFARACIIVYLVSLRCNGQIVGIGVGGLAYHTCTVGWSGQAWCAGLNTYGQLGENITIQQNSSVQVLGLASAVSYIAVGYQHTCSIVSGQLWCFGLNNWGQIGDNTTTNRLLPVAVGNLLSGINTVAAGSYHTCATNTSGSMFCWGYNGYSQIGDGTPYTRMLPYTVPIVTAVAFVGAGQSHTCAASVYTIWCWGYNALGQVGNNSTVQAGFPALVLFPSIGVSGLASGGSHNCALNGTGSMWCWGNNNYGQVGDGTQSNRLVPVPVPGSAAGVLALAAGFQHTCAVNANGGLLCWGYNNYGQVGNGGTGQQVVTLTPVVGLSTGVASVTTGYYHTCALTQQGLLYCWGFNQYGLLGLGYANVSSPYIGSTSPVLVPGLPSPSPTPSLTPTISVTPSFGSTLTGTPTPSGTATFSRTASFTPSPSVTASTSTTVTTTSTVSASGTSSPSPTPSTSPFAHVWGQYGRDGSHSGQSAQVGPVGPSVSVRWSSSAGNVCTPPAIAADGSIFFSSTDANVYALNADGSARWAFQTGAAVVASPALSPAGLVFVGSKDKTIYALLATSGSVMWSMQAPNQFVAPPAVGPDGTVYAPNNDRNSLYALQGTTGALLWNSTLVAKSQAAPAVAASGKVVVVSCVNGYLYALSTASGAQQWMFTASSNLFTSPSLDFARVYAGCADNSVYSVSLSTGSLVWSFLTLNPVSAPLCLSGDGTTVFAASSDGFVYALATGTGTLLWSVFSASGVSFAFPPALSSTGVLFVGGSDNVLRALSTASNGAVAWNYTLPSSNILQGPPVVSNTLSLLIPAGTAMFALASPSASATTSATPSSSSSPTLTCTLSATTTVSSSLTLTTTLSSSASSTVSPSATGSWSPTITSTLSGTATATESSSGSVSTSPSTSVSSSGSGTGSITPSTTAATTASVTMSLSAFPTPSSTATYSLSASAAVTSSMSVSASQSASTSQSSTASASPTSTASVSNSGSCSPSTSVTVSVTVTHTSLLPINCLVSSEWSEWSSCLPLRACDSIGYESRNLQVLQYADFGGIACPEGTSLVQSEQCVLTPPQQCSSPCTDGVLDYGESGVDCGGATVCNRCTAGQTCTANTDCATGLSCSAFRTCVPNLAIATGFYVNVSVSFVGASETQLLAPAVLSSVTGILTNFVGDALHVSLPNWSGAAIRSSSSLASGPLYCNVSVPSEGTWKRLSAVVLLNFVVALDLVGLQASTVPSAVNLNTALVAEAQDVEAEILLALVATVPSVCSVHFEFTDGTLGQYGTASLQFQGGPSTGGGVSSSVNTAIVAGVAGGSSLLILIASFAWLRARSRHKELLRKFAGGRRLRDDTGPSGGMSITLSPMYSGRAGAEAKAAHIEEEEDGATALFAGSSARASGRLGMSPVLSTRPGMVENPLLAAGLAGKLRLGTQMQIRQNHGEDVDRVDI